MGTWFKLTSKSLEFQAFQSTPALSRGSPRGMARCRTTPQTPPKIQWPPAVRCRDASGRYSPPQAKCRFSKNRGLRPVCSGGLLSLGVTIDRRREKGTPVVVEPASPIVAMAISYAMRSADVSKLWLLQVTQSGRSERISTGSPVGTSPMARSMAPWP